MRRKNITSEMMMECISQALLLLMKDQSYQEITIGEITKRAGVNRSTYYRHFSTKESIIRFYLDSIMSEYQHRFSNMNKQSFSVYLKTMFEAFYEKKADLLLIHEAGLSYLLLDVLMERFHFSDIPEEDQFRASYHIGGINSNMLLWFQHDMKETPEDMTRIALQYKPQGTLTLFDKL